MEYGVTQPRKQARHIAGHLATLALDPFPWRASTISYRLIIFSLWRRRICRCALPEMWHFCSISAAYRHYVKMAITLPVELRLGRILPFWKAQSTRDAKISIPRDRNWKFSAKHGFTNSHAKQEGGSWNTVSRSHANRLATLRDI